MRIRSLQSGLAGCLVASLLSHGCRSLAEEGSCAQSVDGRLSSVRRTFWVLANRPADTIFIATTDIPLGGTRQLGAGVVAPTRVRRDSLLSALASLRLGAP